MIATKKILDDIDKKILTGIKDGMTAKAIAAKYNINSNTIGARIREMKRYYQCTNLPQLLLTVMDELQ